MKHLLLTAAAIATLAIPAVSFAQDKNDQPNARRDKAEAARTRQDAKDKAVTAEKRDNRRDRVDNRKTVVVPDKRDNNRGRPDVRVAVGNNRWDRNNRNWWRGRADFKGFAGRRAGYWYRPGVGYFRPDPRWYGYSWRVGGHVPFAYRGYYVADPYFYGLPTAPYGYRYVYLDNNIVLMSVATGLIAQVLANVY